MQQLNLFRIFVSGVAAGIVILVGELILNNILLGGEWADVRRERSIGDYNTQQLFFGAVITLCYGIVLMWIYAAMRYAFGPGFRTLMAASLTFWSIAYLLFLASIANGGMVSERIFIVSTLWGLIEAPIAALVGLLFYRDSHNVVART